MDATRNPARVNGSIRPAHAKPSEAELETLTLRELWDRFGCGRLKIGLGRGVVAEDRAGKIVVPFVDPAADQGNKRLAGVLAEVEKSRERQRCEGIDRKMEEFIEARGRRYAACDFDNFKVSMNAQQQVVDALAAYAGDISQRIADGQNVILMGPSGSGKDHLLTALAKKAIEATATSIAWTSGAELWGALRENMHSDTSEAEILGPYMRAGVLVCSDPKPISGTLTQYQQEQLYRIVDERYNEQRPTWVAINAMNRQEAEDAIGVPIVDRLRDGALSLACNWKSHRTAAT